MNAETIEHDETETKEIATHNQGQALDPQPATGLSPMVQAVMSGQMTPDQLQQLLNVQKEYEKNEAEKAFHQAVAQFKKNPPKVIKDKTNTQFKSKYAGKGNLVNTVNEAMAPFGLTASWDFPEAEGNLIRVTCTLTHAQGHSKSVTLPGPVDTSGAKNPLQQIRSTLTYLEIATFEAVTGIAASDDGDDDGNGSGGNIELITEEQANTIHAKITENGLDMPAFLRWLDKSVKVSAIKDIRANALDTVMRGVNAAIKARGMNK